MFSPQQSEYSFHQTSLFTADGERKYLNSIERSRFIIVANKQSKQIKLLCLVLVLSGCRLTEALNLTGEHLSLNDGAVVIRSLKKRRSVSYRQIPLPGAIITDLQSLVRCSNRNLFPWGRTRALHHVKTVMSEADIKGWRATARALRHTFGVHAVLSDIPLNLIQRWLGHADIKTTAIYTNVLGPEERTIAKRMWAARDQRPPIEHMQS